MGGPMSWLQRYSRSAVPLLVYKAFESWTGRQTAFLDCF
jgi:hypothetical protein